MQDHRNEGQPNELPDPDSVEYHAQKIVLLELVVTPPRAGDHIDDLIERLAIPDEAVAPAITALEQAGLAVREDDTARASAPALYFEYLWPVML